MSSNKRRTTLSPKSAEKNALNLIAEEADSREAKSQQVMSEAHKLLLDERRLKEMNQDDGEDDDLNGNYTPEHTNGTAEMEIENTPNNNSNNNNNNNDSYIEPTENNTDATTPPTPQQNQPTSPPITQTNNQPSTPKQATIQANVQTNKQASTQEDIEEKLKRVMLLNAQLDNETRGLRHQIEVLKDDKEMCSEDNCNLKNKIKKITHDNNMLKIDKADLQHRVNQLQHALQLKDNLFKEHGFSMVRLESTTNNTDNNKINNNNNNDTSCGVLSVQQLDMLSDYSGTLGSRLEQLFEEKSSALEMNKKLQKELDEMRSNVTTRPSSSSSSPSDNPLEANQLIETKYKLKKAEQEITTLQGAVTRLETQTQRYKHAAEELEKAEEALKADKRRLQIELRESKQSYEEVQSKNNHLSKRLEKLKSLRIQEALQ